MNFPSEVAPQVHPLIMRQTVASRCGITTEGMKSGGKDERVLLAKACIAYAYYIIEGFDQTQTSIMVGWRSASSVLHMMLKIERKELDAIASEIIGKPITMPEFAELSYDSARDQTNRLPAHRWPPRGQSKRNQQKCMRIRTPRLEQSK